MFFHAYTVRVCQPSACSAICAPIITLRLRGLRLNDLLSEAELNSPNAIKKPIKIHVHPDRSLFVEGWMVI